MKKNVIFRWDHLLATAVVIAVIKFLPILFTIDFLDPIQSTMEDFKAGDIVFSQLKDYKKVPVDTNIVLVNIGYLNRKGIAELINIVNSYYPKVIGIDSFFRKPKSAEQDSALAQALEKVRNLVLVSKLEHVYNPDTFDTVSYSNKIFNKYATNGFANVITDNANEFRVSRVFAPKQFVKDKSKTFFAVKVAEFYNPAKVKRFLNRNNDIEIINFKRNIYHGKYHVLDVPDVFDQNKDLKFIKGKIVLLGFLGPDINTKVREDIFFTPMNKRYFGRALPDMYGVVLHANIISMIMDEDYISTIPLWTKLLIIFTMIYLNMAFFYYIEENYENVYEAANLFIMIFETFILFAGMVYLFYWFDFDLGLREAALYGIVFSATGFELYHGSFKKMFKTLVGKINKIRTKKMTRKIEEDFSE